MISKIKKRIDKNQYLKIDNIKIYFSFKTIIVQENNINILNSIK